jgi:hypothetical protein
MGGTLGSCPIFSIDCYHDIRIASHIVMTNSKRSVMFDPGPAPASARGGELFWNKATSTNALCKERKILDKTTKNQGGVRWE